MALLFMDGFDVRGGTLTDYSAQSPAYRWSSFFGVSSAGRTGDGWQTTARMALSTPVRTQVFVGIALRTSSSLSPQTRFVNLTGTDAQNPTTGLAVRFLSTGALQLETGAGVVMGTSTAGLLTTSSWYYIEIGVTFGASQSVEVRLDGATVISLSGVDTRGGLASGYSFVTLQGDPSFPPVHDDFYIADNTGAINNNFLGPVKVHTLVPTAAGDLTQWTPSAGSNWQCVDEVTLSTDTVSANTAGLIDLYNMQNLPAGVTSVLGVMTGHRSAKSDTGNRKIMSKIRVGSDTADGVTADQVMNVTRTTLDLFERQPDGTSAWTVSAVDSMQVGVESV